MIIKREKEFQLICKVTDLKENEGKRFIIDDVEFAVFKVKGEIFALNNICPHQKSAIIYNGFIEDGKVVCPAHGWEFNLCDGKQGFGKSGLDSYSVKVENGNVYVKVFSKELDW